MTQDVCIRLFGSVGGSAAAGPFDPGPPRRQALLAILAARAPHAVSIPSLIDGLWGAGPPRTAQQSIYTYVAGLRHALEPARGPREPSTLIVAAGGGYALRLNPRRVDARLFSSLLDEARLLREEGEHAEALVLIERALKLYQDQPLSGVPGPFAENERARLQELHATAVEDGAHTLLELEEPARALPPLRETLARHPLRERLRELLMLALHRCGRQAEALQIFAEGRRILADELGTDPGEDLRRCHELILGGPPAVSGRAPRQLPRPLVGFVGRSEEVAWLKDVLAPCREDPPHPLTAISGPPGIGKSALALHVAHQVRDDFPDGQLFVNLRGKTHGVAALTPLEVLGRLLRAMRTPPQAVPGDLDEAAAVWRGRIDGRRVLIVLDDATGLEQIEPVLSTPLGTAVVATSRETLIAGDDCRQLKLGALSADDSAAMLAVLAGERRVLADPEQTGLLARLCGGLPLALRISGARLAEHPGWSVADLAARLSDERRRLHELRIGELTVHSSLASSWSALAGGEQSRDRAAARLLALLGALHVPEVTSEVSTALLDRPDVEADAALERLAHAHLLERGGPGRYHLHDLVRLFAAGLEPDGAREAVIRALTHYVVSARHAGVLLDPHRVQPVARPVEGVPVRLDDRDQAYEWLSKEEANLLAAASQAMSCVDEEVSRLGVDLAFALMWFQSSSYRRADLLSCNSQALAVAERLGEPALALYAHGHLAGALVMLGRLPEAAEHREAELALARRLGDRFAEQRALGNLGNLYVTWKRFDRSLGFAEAQLAIATEIGSDIGIRYAHLVMGESHRGLGRLAEAHAMFTEALDSATRDGDVLHAGSILTLLGEVCLDQGRPLEAVTHLEQSVRFEHDTRRRIGELRSLTGLARAYREIDRLDDALDHVERAAPLARALGPSPWADEADAERAAVHAALGVPGMSEPGLS
ncbi:BTAD domain-containing putative transcriptional regulator [Nonomuraea sp. NPDC050547]|uniref:AfsR/SARP family transcriptional regulator n=1 Tax=Nonomuraea sp. NPDC050547 TaxID=3364368 RepID=UPI0037A9DA73